MTAAISSSAASIESRDLCKYIHCTRDRTVL